MNVRAEITVGHEAAMEAACALDRAYAQRHPHARSYIRAALAHELCPPGGQCGSVNRVLVTFWAPGLRSRVGLLP